MKAEQQQQEVQEGLKPALAELLGELKNTARGIDLKKANLRQIKRSLANIKAILADVDEELK